MQKEVYFGPGEGSRGREGGGDASVLGYDELQLIDSGFDFQEFRSEPQ